MTNSKKLRCVVVTPEQTVLDTEADFVALPLFDGEIGIAPLRSPLIGRVGYGELKIRNGRTTSRYYIDGGFVQVVNDVVSILTNRAFASAEVDKAAAAGQLASALTRKATTQEEFAIRNRLISQARAQLRIAERV